MLVKKFSAIGISDIASVGGKNASLGEMHNQLISKGVRIANGFATTSTAFWKFLEENRIREPLENIMSGLDRDRYVNLSLIGERARDLILRSEFSKAFSKAIEKAYKKLTMVYAPKNDTATILNIPTPTTKQDRYVLSDEEVIIMENGPS